MLSLALSALILFNLGFSGHRGGYGGTHHRDHNRGYRKTDISAQVFCDNYCTVYFNGELVFDDTSFSRPVQTFNITDVPKRGNRTFAVMLKDHPYDVPAGIWQNESPNNLIGQFDPNTGLPIVRQYCLGDGAFKAIFKDDKCEDEVVVSSADWKCNVILSGPRDIEACFPNWSTDSLYPVPAGINDSFFLTDPCIRSSDPDFAPDFANCDCTNDFNADYVNWATTWYLPGFDDSEWSPATVFTEEQALPGLGGSPRTGCYENAYCDYDTFPPESWGNSDIIWTEELELDNVIVCRYEYESVCSKY